MANSSQTIAIYNAVLQRDPTDSELAAFVAASSSTAGEAQQIDLLVNSTEATTFVYPVVSLYQATFGRVPEPGGLNFWVDYFRDATTGDDAIEPFDALSVINAGFAAADEFEALYPGAFESGVADEAFLNAIYMNVLGREPDQAGFDEYLGAPIEAVLTAFAVSSETIAQYDTAIDLFLTKAANGTQDYTGSLLDLNDDGVVDDQDGVETDGQTFTLTENSDTIPGLIGSKGTDDTSGDDVIVAGLSSSGGFLGATNTLGTGDLIDAGTGFDTLRVIDSGSALTPNLTSVERIDVQSLTSTSPLGNNGTLLNLINANGVEQVWNVNSTEDLEVIEINDDVVLGFQDTGTNIDASFDEGAIADGAIDVALIGSGDEPTTAGATDNNPEGASVLGVTAEDSSVTTLNVAATGGASRLSLGTIDTGMDDITDVNITGDADLFLNISSIGGEVETVTSTSSGNTILLFGGSDEDITVTTGEGDDRLVTNADEFNADDSVDLGEGSDELELHFGGGDIELDSVDGDDEPDNDQFLGVNAAMGVETFIVDVWQSTTEVVNLNASFFDNIDDFVITDTTVDGSGATNVLDDDLQGAITISDVEDDDTFTFGTNVTGGATFDAADDAEVLNLSAEGSINSLTASGFGDVNVNFVELENGTNTLFDVSDETTVNVTGTSEGFVALSLADGEDLTLDASGLETEGEIVTTTNLIDETEYDATNANLISGAGGDDTLIGTEQDDVFDGGLANNPAGLGVTEINLNNLDDLDEDDDSDDEELLSVSVDVDTDGDDVVDTTFTGTGATIAAIAQDLAGELFGAGFTVEADSGVVTITSDTPNAIAVDNVAATVQPDEEDTTNPTGTYTAEVETEAAEPAVQELTFSTAPGTYADGQTITYTFDDGGTGAAVPVSITVETADIVAGDAVATAANVAQKFLSAFAAASGVTDEATGSRSQNVVTITSVNGGQTGNDEAIIGTETTDDGNAVTSNIVNPGNDAVAGNQETFTFNNYTVAAGVVATDTITFAVDGVEAEFTGFAAGDTITGTQIADGLRAADAGNTTFEATGGGSAVVNFVNDDNTAPTIDATVQSEPADIDQDEDVIVTETDNVATVSSTVDTYTGNGGDDVFVIDSLLGPNGAATEAGADTVTDFSAGDLLDFANLDIGGTADNYSEGPGGLGNFASAVTQARSDFQANDDLVYSAQEVLNSEGGTDVYIFTDPNGAAAFTSIDVLDNVVKLAGVSLTDLANDGSFIAV